MEIDNKTILILKSNENEVYTNNFWKMKGELEFIDQWFLMESPIPLTIITICYLLFVLKLGPAYMKSRQPYDLRTILIFYNIGQIIMSTIMFSLSLNLIVPNGLILRKCLVSEETNRLITTAMYYYFICKLSELLDTVFFVLRKKQNQVSFLHVYHHTLMACGTWMTLKMEPTYTTVFLGTVNTFVHIVMYTYYALSAFPNMTKYLWWKKYITKMQLVQFILVILQAIATHLVSDCKPSYMLAGLIIFNGILFLYLFGDFYFKAYLQGKGKRCTVSDQGNTEIKDKSNGVIKKRHVTGKEANGSTIYRNGVNNLKVN